MDVQSAQRQTVLTNEVINAIPTAGCYNALLVLVPGVFGGQQDVSTGPCNSCTFSAHGTLLSLAGNRANTEARLLVDGISIAVPQAGGTNYLTDTRNAQEVTFTVSGSMGEVESGGPVMNIIPQSGGNTLSGSGFVAWANGDLQGSNLSDELQGARASRAEPAHQELRRQRRASAVRSARTALWFFGTVRGQGNSSYITNMYYNKNAGDPNKWLYEPDLIAAGVQRQDVAERQRPHHRAGHAAQQGERVLGRAEGLPELRERRQLRQRHHLARGATATATCTRCASSRRPGPRRSATSCSSKAASATSSRAGAAAPRRTRTPSDLVAHHRAVRGRLPGQRQHPEPDVPLADDRPVQRRPQQEHHHHLARGGVRTSPARSSFKFGYIGNQLGDIRSANRSPNDLRYRVNNGVPNQLTQLRPQPAERSVDAQRRASSCRSSGRRPAHAAGRAALRPRVELGAAQQTARARFCATPLVVRGDAGRGQLQRPHAARGGHLRSLRQRQDGAQGARSASISSRPSRRRTTGSGNPTSRIAHERGAHLDRRQRQLDPGLRPPQPATRRTSRPTGGDFCGAYREPQLRHGDLQQHDRPDILSRLGRAAVRLAAGRLGAARSAAARVGRGRLLPPRVLRLHRHRQPGRHAADFDQFSSRRRRIRGCPAAAATRVRALRPERRRSSA